MKCITCGYRFHYFYYLRRGEKLCSICHSRECQADQDYNGSLVIFDRNGLEAKRQAPYLTALMKRF